MPRSTQTTAATSHAEQARKKAEKFFRRLLVEAYRLPRSKLLAKGPAAIAACYAIFSLMDGPDAQETAVLLTMLGTIKRLYESDVEL